MRLRFDHGDHRMYFYLFYSSFEIRDVKEEYLDAVDLVESAFAILTENVVSMLFVPRLADTALQILILFFNFCDLSFQLWKNKDGLLKTLETITKVNMVCILKNFLYKMPLTILVVRCFFDKDISDFLWLLIVVIIPVCVKHLFSCYSLFLFYT